MTKSILKYNSPIEPAPDIITLVEYLINCEKESSNKLYIYRGQTKEYNLPLIPSLFRNFLDPRYPERKSTKNLTGFGNIFTRIYLPQNVTEIAEFLFKKKIAPLLDNLLSKLDESIRPFTISNVDSRFINSIIEMSGITLEGAFSKPQDESMQRDKLGVIDLLHRIIIRLFATTTSFGYPISDFLCQQYGLTSGFLDASYSIEVAAFFATYYAPYYMDCVTNSGIGVIYRFDATANISDDYNPSKKFEFPYLFGDKIFMRFEDLDTDYSNIYSLLDEYYFQLTFDKPNLDILTVPKGSLEMSRIGRQQSVMLSPLLIHTDDGKYFIGVEDLKSRPGFQAFFFKHTEVNSKYPRVNRNWLWPLIGDVYRQWLGYSLLLDSKQHLAYFADKLIKLPKRIDLINTGYEFAEEVIVDYSFLSSVKLEDAKTEVSNKELNKKKDRLKNILQSVNQILVEESTIFRAGDKIQKTFGNNSHLAFAIDDLLKKELTFLEELSYSKHVQDQYLKARALFCYGVIMLKAAQMIEKSTPVEYIRYWISLIRTSAFLGDLYGDENIAFTAYSYMIIFYGNIYLSRSDISRSEKIGALYRTMDCLDELLTLSLWLQKANESSNWIVMYAKMFGDALNQLCEKEGQSFPEDRWKSLMIDIVI